MSQRRSKVKPIDYELSTEYEKLQKLEKALKERKQTFLVKAAESHNQGFCFANFSFIQETEIDDIDWVQDHWMEYMGDLPYPTKAIPDHKRARNLLEADGYRIEQKKKNAYLKALKTKEGSP